MIDVQYHCDAAAVLRISREFLASDPVLHNVILTILQERQNIPEPGRYWISRTGTQVTGMVVQSPPVPVAHLSCMTDTTCTQMVDCLAAQGVNLSGVVGEASVTSRFAAQWSERLGAPAAPVKKLGTYVLDQIQGTSSAPGHLRQAVAGDRSLVLAWMREFLAEVGESDAGLEAMVDERLVAKRYWIWEDTDRAATLVGYTGAVEGMTRIRVVYTPMEKRGRGYASAAVRELSGMILAQGCRGILYTDLSNPVSNTIYQQIGYRLVAEAVRYRFD